MHSVINKLLLHLRKKISQIVITLLFITLLFTINIYITFLILINYYYVIFFKQTNHSVLFHVLDKDISIF